MISLTKSLIDGWKLTIRRIKKLAVLLIFILSALKADAIEIERNVFSLLNLNYKGLEKVKKLHLLGRDKEAAQALLSYYRSRNLVVNPGADANQVSISAEEQKMADDAMQHTFFSYVGFTPLHYGKDINWAYWPVQDLELRWQLHRQKWFIPMGKAYRLTGNESYAREWMFQYLDWIKKNPLEERKSPLKNLSREEQLKEDNKVEDDNMRFAWRPMEVSHRLADQYTIFQYFINSPSFSPEFLTIFLTNTHRHAQFVNTHYSKEGNHLLFEAQRILSAGVFFPEFKDAQAWRNAGVKILNREIAVQVYEDGFQFELDPGYHNGAIHTFLSALRVSEENGYRNLFPASYRQTIAKMIEASYNILLPDLSIPMFSDAGRKVKKDAVRNFSEWLRSFPQDKALQYFVTEGRSGALPTYVSKAFKTSGFYALRSSWNADATAMILKAGPPAFWHCQLDNGTFELMIKGRNFFPDAGSYSYGGDEEIMKMRNWFRQTMVHKTLTLNNANLEKADSKCLLWQADTSTEILVIENPSYQDLKHRRSVFFVDKKFFVVVDEAMGQATGKVGVHYQLGEGPASLDVQNNKVITQFSDDNNVLLQTFCNQSQNLIEEEGWVSYKAKEKFPRKAFVFETDKNEASPARFITVILPVKNQESAPPVTASFEPASGNLNGLKVRLKIGNTPYYLNYTL